MMWLLIVPVISAFAGFFISSIAVKMLLSSKRIKENSSKSFEENLTDKTGPENQEGRKLGSFSNLEADVSNPANVEKILPLLESHVDIFLREKLSTEIPMIGMLIGEKTILKVKEVFLKELKELFPVVIQQYIITLKQNAEPKKPEIGLSQRAKDYSNAKLSAKIRSVKIVGAIVGFVIGLLQLLVINVIIK